MSMNEILLKPERQFKIHTMLESGGRATVFELSEKLNVSEATIRRDLEEMDSKGLLQRTHGGALKMALTVKEPPILQRVTSQQMEKRAIGTAAVQLLKEHETIFLSSGSTVLEIARCISEGFHLTVITNSLPVITELASRTSIELIVIGGTLRQSQQSMHWTHCRTGDSSGADRVFIGMRAIDPVHGFTNDYLPEILADRAILSIASQVIVVADHTKFGRISPVYVAPVTAADLIITDLQTEPGILDELQEAGVQILKVTKAAACLQNLIAHYLRMKIYQFLG